MTYTTTVSDAARRLLAAGAFAALLTGLAGAGPASAAGCGSCDDDHDGLTNQEEFAVYFTDLADWDTDGDGFGDGEEVYYYGYDPLVFNGGGIGDYGAGGGYGDDSDGDGLYDIDEDKVYGTDRYRFDSDGDGWGDGEEVYYGSSPVNRYCDPTGCG